MMTALHRAWASLRPGLRILDPVEFAPEHWPLVERLHADFNDREAQTRLPLPIARFRASAVTAIHDRAKAFDDVRTISVDDAWLATTAGGAAPDAMANDVRLYNDDVDALMRVLVPAAHYRKGHYAYGRFTVPQPHGLHTDQSAEDPGAAGEPTCIARIATLGTHYVPGDDRTFDGGTRRRLEALRYWTAGPEGPPETILDDLLKRGTLKTMPVNHVMLMVAGNPSENTQTTQHIAARPPDGGLHSAFFQRQYRLI